MNTCLDCGTGWFGSMVACPMCGSINIEEPAPAKIIKVSSIPVPRGLEEWYRNTMKVLNKHET